MSLRFRLFIFPTLAIAAAAGFIAWQSEQYARRQFQEADRQRTEALAAQFHQELAQRGDELVLDVQTVADSEATLRMALDLNRPQADLSLYANDARGIANAYHLDFLELAASDGSLISSAQWPTLSGYHNDWVAAEPDWNHQGAFLNRVQLPDGVQLGLLAVRAVPIGDRKLYIIGGWRIDNQFLKRLALPAGSSALLYANLDPTTFLPTALAGPDGPVTQAEDFAPIIDALRRGQTPQPQAMPSSSGHEADAETFVGVPLAGRGKELLGALLLGNSQRGLLALVNYIRYLAALAAGAGFLFSLLLSWWVSSRVSRPIAQLTAAAREVQSGKFISGASILDTHSGNEAGKLTGAVSDIVGQVSREREKLIQGERVAARREMARRFTREIKESLFPLHMAAEDLIHAREETSERFDEIFFDSMASLRAELMRLRAVAARFGQFASMPAPKPAPMYVNEATRAAMNSVEPYLRAEGRPPVTPEVRLAERDPIIRADAGLLRMAVENILLDCMDAMSGGGTLVVATREKEGLVRIEISARGARLGVPECARLFTPGSPGVEGMRGLGLATAHAVVSDLGGRISAEASPDGPTFRLEFSAAPAGVTPAPPSARPTLQLASGLPPEPSAAERSPAEAPVALAAAPGAAAGAD